MRHQRPRRSARGCGEHERRYLVVRADHVAHYLGGLARFDHDLRRHIRFLRDRIGGRADIVALFDAALDTMRAAGATIVEIKDSRSGLAGLGDAEFEILMTELKADMAAYLAGLPGKGAPRSLADLIAFNEANAETEMRWFGQDLFIQAEGTTDRKAYEAARKNAIHLAGERTIDLLLAENDVSFLVAPTRGPAWVSDLINGDNFNGSIGFGAPAAIAGYPHLTVPMGAIEGLPVGLSIIGAKWDDHAVLKAGAAYERARSAVLPQPRFERWQPALRPSAPATAN